MEGGEDNPVQRNNAPPPKTHTGDPEDRRGMLCDGRLQYGRHRTNGAFRANDSSVDKQGSTEPWAVRWVLCRNEDWVDGRGRLGGRVAPRPSNLKAGGGVWQGAGPMGRLGRNATARCHSVREGAASSAGTKMRERGTGGRAFPNDLLGPGAEGGRGGILQQPQKKASG